MDDTLRVNELHADAGAADGDGDPSLVHESRFA
jgi:hypothetical protein